MPTLWAVFLRRLRTPLVFVILAFLLGMNFVRRRRARHTEHERSEHAHE